MEFEIIQIQNLKFKNIILQIGATGYSRVIGGPDTGVI